MTNILVAVKNLIENNNFKIVSTYKGLNRANAQGDALESYIKDLFTGGFGLNKKDSFEVESQKFSWLGNSNNPPDFIIRNSAAVEVKKITSPNAGIALNSSFPKDKLYSNDPLLHRECSICEDGWTEKDMIYAIGYIKKEKLKSLWLLYGDCYCANKRIYKRIKSTISEGVDSIPNVEFSETRELGRVNKVDPLGITYLRIRGMWGIENPNKVFDYLDLNLQNTEFTLNCLIKKNKLNEGIQNISTELDKLKRLGLEIKDVSIKDPNNPANKIDCYHLNYKV